MSLPVFLSIRNSADCRLEASQSRAAGDGLRFLTARAGLAMKAKDRRSSLGIEMFRFAPAVLLAVLLGLAGCNGVAKPSSVPVDAVPEPPQPGVVGSAAGRELDEQDRATAIAAQSEAVNSGRPQSWKGAKTAYGFITPGPESGGCRDYTHKIFINGRPQEAKGRACKTGEVWRVVS
jgi:surface antigen